MRRARESAASWNLARVKRKVTPMRHLIAAAFALGCSVSAEIAPRDCTPGTTAACACPGGSVGAQVCDEAGAVGTCSCPAEAPPVPADASDASTAVPPADVPAMGAQEAGTVDAAVSADVVAPPTPTRDVVACDPRHLCGATCVDSFATDPANCGACGVRCSPRADGGVPACSQGVCVHRCAPGLVACSLTRCADPTLPGFDCQQCSWQCAAGFVCSPRTSRCERG